MNRRDAWRAAMAWAASSGLLVTEVRAQQQGRVARIGYLGLSAPEPTRANTEAFEEGLREQGLLAGRNVELVQRWAHGSVDALSVLARELVALQVDVIIAGNNTAIAAAQRATATIPIVMILGVDPVRNGFIESFARPGRNITGLTNDSGPAMHGKMLSLLRELVPAASVVGVLAQHGLGFDRAAVEQAARELKIELQYAPEVRQSEDMAPALQWIKRTGAQAMYVIGGANIYQNRQAVADLARSYRLPGIFFSSDYVRAGGLVSYGTDLRAQTRRSAFYVARILKGAQPSELPVEQPAKFELAINVNTAKALGLAVPQSLLLRADEVIR
jgi:putative ABC transport system substrate-binding protein